MDVVRCMLATHTSTNPLPFCNLECKGSNGGTVVRALASHQYGPAKFKSPHQRHMRLEFVTSSFLCSKRFFSLYSGFPLLKKPTLLNSNLTRNRSFLHSCKQRHQLEARVDKIQWFVWNCQPKPHPHFFMFVYWSIIRERSSVDEETLCSCSLSLLFSLVICFISFNLHQTFNLQESAMIKSALQSDWF